MVFLNRTAIFLCVLVYVLTGNTLQSQYVYVVTSFYGILRQALTMFLPQGVTTLAETNVSIKRIEKFLLYDEIEYELLRKKKIKTYLTNTKKDGKARNGVLPLLHKAISVSEDRNGILLDNVSVKWLSSSPEYTLEDVTINVGPHQIVAVVGPVGSGKTTLLHVMLKELSLLKGNINIGGTISYASQEPWLFGGSIRQNILFGQTMETKRYNEIVKVCALERDFSLFPYGDRTLVGERGAMLSGGQKARINLARAIYKDADVYLLDDPLSAVDTHVGRQLFDECILGYLKSKCVVLVTHQLQYLKTVDNIYLLDNGKIAKSGTYSQLKNSDEEFLKLLEGEAEDEAGKKDTIKKVKSAKSMEKIDLPTEVKEQRGSGTISSKVYKDYIKAGGSLCLVFLFVVLFILVQVLGSGADYYLTFWVNLEQTRLQENFTASDSFIYTFFTAENCLYIYTVAIVILISSALTRSISFFTFCMRSSRNLHNFMFSRIVYAPMRFFNLNSSGRILNRFSKDMGAIDETLPNAIMDTVQIGLTAFSIIIVVAMVNPWILIPSVIILGLFYVLRVIFLASSRDVKRIEGTSKLSYLKNLAKITFFFSS